MAARIIGGLLALVFLLALTAVRASWTEDKTSGVQAEEQTTERVNEESKNGRAPQIGAQDPTSNEQVAEKKSEASEDASEFWPALFGKHFKITDTLLIFFTGILAWKTWGLDSATRKLWLAGEKQIEHVKTTANAAKASAEAAVAQVANQARIERPILAVKDIAVKPFTVLPDNKLPAHLNVVLRLQNYGRSPAELTDYYITVATVAPEGANPCYGAEYGYPPGIYRNPGEAETFPFIFNLREKELTGIESGDMNLWLYGFCKYEDLFGNKHEYRFCRMALYRSDRPGRWFDWVSTKDMPAEYLKRT